MKSEIADEAVVAETPHDARIGPHADWPAPGAVLHQGRLVDFEITSQLGQRTAISRGERDQFRNQARRCAAHSGRVSSGILREEPTPSREAMPQKRHSASSESLARAPSVASRPPECQRLREQSEESWLVWVHSKLLLIGRPVQTMQLAVCHHGVPSTLCRKRRTVGGSPDGDSFSGLDG